MDKKKLQFRALPMYLVRFQDQEQGPFAPDFIKAMVVAGVYPRDVSVRKLSEVDWFPFSTVTSVESGLAGPGSLSEKVQPTLPGQSEMPRVKLVPTLPDQSDMPQVNLVPTHSDTHRKPKKKDDSVALFGRLVGIGAVIFFAWILMTVYGRPKGAHRDTRDQTFAGSKTERLSSPPKQPTPAPSPYSAPYRPATPPAGSSSRPVKPDDTRIFRDASGRTYRVPDVHYPRLLSMQSALVIKKTGLDMAETSFDSMQGQLESRRRLLDRTSQFEVDEFNRAVARVNAENERLQQMVRDYNRDVDAFNSELARVGTLAY